MCACQDEQARDGPVRRPDGGAGAHPAVLLDPVDGPGQPAGPAHLLPRCPAVLVSSWLHRCVVFPFKRVCTLLVLNRRRTTCFASFQTQTSIWHFVLYISHSICFVQFGALQAHRRSLWCVVAGQSLLSGLRGPVRGPVQILCAVPARHRLVARHALQHQAGRPGHSGPLHELCGAGGRAGAVGQL